MVNKKTLELQVDFVDTIEVRGTKHVSVKNLGISFRIWWIIRPYHLRSLKRKEKLQSMLITRNWGYIRTQCHNIILVYYYCKSM